MYRRDNQRQYEMKATSASECQAWIDNIKMARSVNSIDINKTYLFHVFFLTQILIISTQHSTVSGRTLNVCQNPLGYTMLGFITFITFHEKVFQKLV